MKVTMLLCDAVQVAEGKINMLGGGWTQTVAGAAPSGIALIFHVPWVDANRQLLFKLALLTADGQAVTQSGPLGQAPIEVEGQFEVGRPAGVAHGSTIDAPLAVNMPPLPLAEGARYVWKLWIDGDTNQDWELPFATRPSLRASGPASPTDF